MMEFMMAFANSSHRLRQTAARLSTVVILACLSAQANAQRPNAIEPAAREQVNATSSVDRTDDRMAKVLTEAEWRQVDVAVDRAIEFLISQQQSDGSFPTNERAQPAVTSLCVLSLMSHGHLPGEGRYGRELDRAAEFIVACQKANGL